MSQKQDTKKLTVQEKIHKLNTSKSRNLVTQRYQQETKKLSKGMGEDVHDSCI